MEDTVTLLQAEAENLKANVTRICNGFRNQL